VHVAGNGEGTTRRHALIDVASRAAPGYFEPSPENVATSIVTFEALRPAAINECPVGSETP